jgi:hypothetical protein
MSRQNFRPLVSDLFLRLIALGVMIDGVILILTLILTHEHGPVPWAAIGLLGLSLLQVVGLIYLVRELGWGA